MLTFIWIRVVISWCGSWIEMVSSQWNHFTNSWHRGESRRQNFPAKNVWKTKVPPRIAFFAWEPWISWWEEVLLGLTDATYANRLRNHVVIYFFGAQRLTACGLWFFFFWDNRLWSMVYSLIGISWWLQGLLRRIFRLGATYVNNKKFLELLLWCCFGWFGKRKIAGLLRVHKMIFIN